jgi:uncharacterized membrane protein
VLRNAIDRESEETLMSSDFRLTGRSRKLFLVLHIIAAALWFGVDIALGTLALTAVLADDPRVAGTALQAIPMFAIWPMFGASLVSLVTGVLLGLGSKYGLLKYWWVAVKLAANLLMSTLIVLSLRPGVDDAAEIGRRLGAGDPTAVIPSDLLYPVFVAPSLLLLSFVLSVWKPRARLRGRRTRTKVRPAAALVPAGE